MSSANPPWRAGIAQREAFIGIADAETIPGCPPNEIYYDVQTYKGDISMEKLPKVRKIAETGPRVGVNLAKRIIRDLVEKQNAKHNLDLPPEQKT